ncbi:MAG: GNAT family N-acetyltransferase [Oscillospiraceae bacterium]|nr:GNAT family N-acetyltransferase [Oscillospiraceae bacterium]
MIVQAGAKDAATVAKLAVNMWSTHTVTELTADFEQLLAGKNAAVFLLYVEEKAVGFAQCQLRTDYVEGTQSSPVGYLEGVYIEKALRSQGYGRLLLRTCEQWAKERGCKEFASDCEMNNTQSLAFHLHSGFDEVNRIICFAKKL